jgi:K+-sensing histidine kinase KdpD/ActR/RegA family two-component response regulator
VTYAAAIAVTAAAVGVRWLLEPVVGNYVPFITFFAATAFSVWYGGYLAGTLSALLGAVAGVVFFVEPRGRFELSSARDRISLVAYFVANAIIIFLGHALRSARDRAEKEREFTQALHRYLDRIQRAPALGDVYETALDTIVGMLGCDRASVLVYDERRVMRFVAWRGLSDVYRRGTEGHSPWAPDARDPEPVCISDVRSAELEPALKGLVESEGIRSLCFIPLLSSSRLIGKFIMYFGERRTFSDYELGIARTIGLELAAGIERKLAEQKLRDSEARFEAEARALARLNEASSRLWRIRDLHEGLDEVLAAAIDLLGADKGNIQLLAPDRRTLFIASQRGFDQNFLDAFHEVPDDDSVCGRALLRGERVVAEDVETEPDFVAMRTIARASGFRAVQSTLLRGRDGEPFGVLSTHFREPHRPSEQELRRLDLYAREAAGFIERWNAEDALRRKEQAGREANRAKDEFLAMLSHELRNPIAAITSAAAILQRLDGLPAQAATAGAIVDRQAMHLARLVDDLLDISRVTRGKIGFEKRPFSAADAIELACETARPALEARRQTLVESIAAEPPGLMGDLNRLAQAIANVLHNASRYSPEGTRIHLFLEAEGDQAIVRIRDEGRGMSPDLMERIFDPFVQGRAERNGAAPRPPPGLGLGLTLARAVVEHHRGTIEASSAGPGRGSEFTIRLPALRSESRPEDAPDPDAAAPAVRPPRRILVVDDNADSASGLAELLGLDGHEVRTSPDGETALVAAADFCPEIVFLDIGLPGIDGYETARRLRAVPAFAGTRLVALTGYGQDEDRRRAEEAGFDSHVVKPLRAADLDRIFGSGLGSGSRNESPAT